MKLLSRFIHRLLRGDVECLQIAFACGYGLYLWLAQSFDAPNSGPGLRTLGQIAQRVAPEFDAEALWGSVMIGGGLLALMGLVTKQLRVRQIAAVLLAALWLLMAGCFWTANHRSPGFLTYVVFAWFALVRACHREQPDRSEELAG